MATIGIFYGSTEGNTERVVTAIQQKLGGEATAALHNVNSATADDIAPYANVILACPTWEIGQLQEDWEKLGTITNEAPYPLGPDPDPESDAAPDHIAKAAGRPDELSLIHYVPCRRTYAVVTWVVRVCS